MNGESLDLTEDLINQLKAIIPTAFTEGRLDVNSLKTLIGEDVIVTGERYELNWPGKADAYKVLQRPTTETLVPNPEDSINWDETENVFIEGENLAVLKVLQKSYYGKIKMIYIDPPYNTGSDSFIYPDKFSETREEYAQRVGTKDEEGYMMKDGMFRKNSKDSGHYHSNWLNMMLPRLHLARNLMTEDGVIFVSIDDNEQANLKLLMDQVFGEENFIANVVWKHTEQSKNDERFFSRQFNYLMIYGKSTDELEDFRFPRTKKDNVNYSNPDDDPNGDWRHGDVRSPNYRKTLCYEITAPSGKVITPPKNGWRWKKEKVLEKIATGEIYFNEDETQIKRKIYLKNQDGRVPENLWQGNLTGTTRGANSELKELFGDFTPFDTPKPIALIKRVMQLFSEKGFIILDFFSGSGTSAHAVLDLNEEDGGNRKFICVQLPEKTDGTSEAYKAGYKTISAIAEARIKKVIEKLESEREGKLALEDQQVLGFRKFTLQDSNFKLWRGDIEDTEKLKQQMLDFVTPEREGALTENILWELLVKNGKLLTEQLLKYEVEDGVLWSIQDGSIAFALDAWNDSVRDKLLELQPQKVIALDSIFDDNDAKKSNAQLQCEDAGISFTTV